MTAVSKAVPDHRLVEFRTAVAADLTVLAILHEREADNDLIQSLKTTGFPKSLGLKLISRQGCDATRMMQNALTELSDPLAPDDTDELAADYAAIYLLHALAASPNESFWVDEDHLERQLSMFQVRACYKRHGLAAADWRKRSDDHLTLQLQFLTRLIEPEKPGDTWSEMAQFMDEHLLRWLEKFALRVANRCTTEFYGGAVLLTNAYCEELRELLARILETPRPSREEIETRMKTTTPAPVVSVKFMPGADGPSW